MRSDGGDIRASKEDNTQLPCDLLVFDYGSESGLLAVKFAGTKATSPEKIRIWCGKADETTPAAGDTYGQYNTYASHWKAFYPDGGGNDRTNNGNNLTMIGSPTVGGATGPIGAKATDYDGSTQYGLATAVIPTAVPLTLMAYVNTDITTDGVDQTTLFLGDSNSTAHYWQLLLQGSGNAVVMRTHSPTSSSQASKGTFSAFNWHRAVGVTATNTSRFAGLDGVLGTEQTTSRTPTPAEVDRIAVGVRGSSSLVDFFNGKLSLISLHNVALSADWIAYDWANRFPATFFGAWTWTQVGIASNFPLSSIYRRHKRKSVQWR